jgi:hypothetical protein
LALISVAFAYPQHQWNNVFSKPGKREKKRTKKRKKKKKKRKKELTSCADPNHKPFVRFSAPLKAEKKPATEADAVKAIQSEVAASKLQAVEKKAIATVREEAKEADLRALEEEAVQNLLQEVTVVAKRRTKMVFTSAPKEEGEDEEGEVFTSAPKEEEEKEVRHYDYDQDHDHVISKLKRKHEDELDEQFHKHFHAFLKLDDPKGEAHRDCIDNCEDDAEDFTAAVLCARTKCGVRGPQ